MSILAIITHDPLSKFIQSVAVSEWVFACGWHRFGMLLLHIFVCVWLRLGIASLNSVWDCPGESTAITQYGAS